jgi:hypothetical protein
MLKTIENFKKHWPGYLEQVYTDVEIQEWLNTSPSVTMAIDYASDHMLAQNLGDVQE